VITRESPAHRARARCRCLPRPIIIVFTLSDPSSAYTNLSGGCMSYVLNMGHSTVIVRSVCVIVMIRPHPLPSSAGGGSEVAGSAAASRAEGTAGGGPLVHRPEKSGRP
jgi:hypothetical protein